MGESYGSPAGTITRCTFSIPNTGASSIASRLVEIRMEGGVAAAGSVLTGAYRQHAVKQVLGVGCQVSGSSDTGHLTPYPYIESGRSSGISRNCSNASGFASASTFLTGWPCTTARTASSLIFPLMVLGRSVT
jgi:hypothetical protein